MVNLLLLLFLTSFPLFASTDIASFDSKWSKHIISSKQPVSLTFSNSNSPIMIIVQNGDVSSYSKTNLNNETKHSTSWLGEGGFYLNFIPANSENVTFEVHTYTDNVINEEVSIKIIELKVANIQLIKAIEDHSQASHLRYMLFRGSKNNNDLAASLYQNSIQVFKNQDQSLLKAIATTELAFINKDLEKNTLAINLFDKASIDWGKLKLTLVQLKSQNFKGLTQWNSYQLGSALDTFESIDTKLQSIQTKSRIYKSFNALILNNIGLIHWELKNGLIAKQYYIQSLTKYGILLDDDFDSSQVIKSIKSNPYYYDIATTLNNLAFINKNLGQPQIAIKIWEVVLAVTNNDLSKLLNAQVKSNLSTIYMDKGDYDTSRELVNQAIQTFRALNRGKWLYIAEYQLSLLNLKLGMINLAEIQFKKNLQLRSSKENPKDVIELNLILMEIYRIQEKFNQSTLLGLQTLKLADSTKHYKSIVKVYQNSFNINLKNNNLSKAQTDIENALLSIKDKTLTKLESELNVNQAELELLQNNSKKAISILHIEANNLRNIWDTNLLNKTNNLLALAYMSQNNFFKALEIIQGEINNLQFYLSSSLNSKTQFSLNSILKESLNIYALVNNQLKQPEMGFIKVNQMLSRFNTKNDSVNKAQFSSNDNNDLFAQINAKSVALENQSHSKSDRKQIQNDMIELKFKIDSSFVAQVPQDLTTAGFKAIQESIDDETLVIQYSIGEAGGISWWIAKDKIETHEVGNKKELTKLINLAHDEFIQKSNSFISIKKLSTMLLGPLKNYNDIKKIHFILDEPLNLVPMNALFDPRTSKRQVLAENTRIKRLSSIQSIFNMKNPIIINRENMSALVIADPVTSAKDGRLTMNVNEKNHQSYVRLNGSKEEAKNIMKVIKAESLQGFDANKEQLLQSGYKQKNILHFATHAFFHPEISGLSSLVLSTYNEKGENNPSSYLRALDISNLELKTELVVLSGCETGVNKYDNSLGLGGLTDSFMQAGAKNLIGSLWKVDDRVTEKMMTEFYHGYVNGLSIDSALAQAQKHIRDTHQTRHPKYWAGWFLLVN